LHYASAGQPWQLARIGSGQSAAFGRITGLDIMAIPFTGQHHH
jgi:hypothetical protein